MGFLQTCLDWPFLHYHSQVSLPASYSVFNSKKGKKSFLFNPSEKTSSVWSSLSELLRTRAEESGAVNQNTSGEEIEGKENM